MTKILRMELRGFKSFSKKHELPFGDGFNVILGPNGSGKSNILDAICFVLGRRSSKSLRADKAGELVFRGGKSKKPAAQASVSIVFDNSSKVFPLGAAEIEVMRSVKPNGNSVYTINSERSTLQQILELLSHAKIDPEGYNIIMQGDIGKFAEMSSDDRRRLVEEISGISLYEEKKEKALHEMEKVTAKLTEADIVLEQRRVHLDELRKDKEQAEKYRDAKSRMDRTQATLFHLDIKDLVGKAEKLEKEKAELAAKTDEAQRKGEGLRAESAKTRDTMNAITQKIEESGEKEQRELLREKEELAVLVRVQEVRIEQCRGEIEKLQSRKEGMLAEVKQREGQTELARKQIRQLGEQEKSAGRDLERVEAEIEKFRKKNDMDGAVTMEEKLVSLDKKLDEMREEADRLTRSKQELTILRERAHIQLETFGEQMAKVKEIRKEHETDIQQLQEKRRRYKTLVLELNKSVTQNSSLAAQIGKIQETLFRLREEQSRQQISQTAQNEKKAASIAVQKIIEQRSRIKGIHGTVSDIAQVPSRYSLALEVAAGARLNNIVVDDEEVASQCIRYLKENRIDQATFLPLTKIRAPPAKPELQALLKTNGVLGFAVSLADHPPKYKKVFEYVFGETIVVETLDVARRIGVGRARMVSLEGDLVETSGAMTGGYRTRKPGTGFSTKESSSQLLKLGEQIAELSAESSGLAREREASQSAIDGMRSEKATLEGEIAAAEKTLHLEESDLELDKDKRLLAEADEQKAEKDLLKIAAQIGEANKTIVAIRTEREQMRQHLQTLRDPKLIAELDSFRKTRDDLRQTVAGLKLKIDGHERQIRDVLQPEVDKAGKIGESIEKERETFRTEQEKLTEDLAKNKTRLKEHTAALEKFFEKYKKLFDEQAALQKRLEELSGQIGEVDAKRMELDHRSNASALKLATVKAELAGLQKAFEPYANTTLLEQKSRSSLSAELQAFQTLMETMGNINMKALEIYEAVEQEYQRLLEKKATLVQEKQEVLDMMQEIEGKKKDLFLSTFDVISGNFRKIFTELAPKGEAWLILENEESPLDGGVEIRARMSEKHPLPIRSLSGGEKTLTALAFIFAIQEHEPASFYVLDEVDAALDKHNSEKLAKVVRKYSGRAQYIIVSHNDFMLGEADYLFGISMNAEGESKITSLKV